MMCNLRPAVSACVTSLAVRLTLYYYLLLCSDVFQSELNKKIDHGDRLAVFFFTLRYTCAERYIDPNCRSMLSVRRLSVCCHRGPLTSKVP